MMTTTSLLRSSLRAIGRHPMRSALTAIGIVIGVGSVIALSAVGAGARGTIAAQIASLGQNLIFVFPGAARDGAVSGGSGAALTLMPEDAAAIRRDLPPVTAISPEVQVRSQVVGNGLNWNTMIIGGSTDYGLLRNWRVASGEMFSEDDVRGYRPVALIGQTVATNLFGDTSPIRRNLRIGRASFTIIGVLAPKGMSIANQDQDDVVIIPYTTHMKRVSRRRSVQSIVLQVADIDQSPKVQAEINDLLADRHKVYGEADFRIADQAEITARATAVTDTMTAFLASVAGISLLVGGIGIMNIMLVSVTERTHEIGIRLAVGAHGRDIRLQFLAEAVIVSLAGGAIGILLGVGGSHLLGEAKNWPVIVTGSSIAGAVAFAAGIGIFFGFYPAQRASQMDPIDALRHE